MNKLQANSINILLQMVKRNLAFKTYWEKPIYQLWTWMLVFFLISRNIMSPKWHFRNSQLFEAILAPPINQSIKRQTEWNWREWNIAKWTWITARTIDVYADGSARLFSVHASHMNNIIRDKYNYKNWIDSASVSDGCRDIVVRIKFHWRSFWSNLSSKSMDIKVSLAARTRH